LQDPVSGLSFKISKRTASYRINPENPGILKSEKRQYFGQDPEKSCAGSRPVTISIKYI